MTTARAVLEARKRQALRDLVEVERQVDAGEIDAETAGRLARVYEAEVARTAQEIDALDLTDRAAVVPDAVGEGAGRAGRSRRRTVVGAGLFLAACGLVVLLVTQAIEPRPEGGFVTGGIAASADDAPMDLADVSNEELEAVVAQNPRIVRMRLALARRYLEARDYAQARRHAEVVLAQRPGDRNRQQALWMTGWATVMLGDPAAGALLLDQSLALDGDDPNVLFFLALTKLQHTDDPAGATSLLERLLAQPTPMSEEERALIQEALTEARRRAAVKTAVTTTAVP